MGTPSQVQPDLSLALCPHVGNWQIYHDVALSAWLVTLPLAVNSRVQFVMVIALMTAMQSKGNCAVVRLLAEDRAALEFCSQLYGQMENSQSVN